MTTCSVEDCAAPVRCKGVCNRHYTRLQRHGDPLIAKRLWKVSRAERLAAYTDRSGGPNACWPWTKALNDAGYGVIANRDGGTAIASRAAYEIAHDAALDPDVDVMHLCNNPPCCNPAHLRAGTRAKNQAYMAASGRTHRGERSPQAKLSDTDVAHMRALRLEGWRLAALADRFAISVAQVSRICNGHQRA